MYSSYRPMIGWGAWGAGEEPAHYDSGLSALMGSLTSSTSRKMKKRKSMIKAAKLKKLKKLHAAKRRRATKHTPRGSGRSVSTPSLFARGRGRAGSSEEEETTTEDEDAEAADLEADLALLDDDEPEGMSQGTTILLAVLGLAVVGGGVYLMTKKK